MKVEKTRFKNIEKGTKFRYGYFDLVKTGNRRAVNRQDPEHVFFFREKDMVLVYIED